MRTCFSVERAAADSGSRSRSSSERAGADAKTAVGERKLWQWCIPNVQSACFVREHRPDSAQMRTHTISSAMTHARHQNPSFRSRKLICRELDRRSQNHARIHKYKEPSCLHFLTCDPPDQALEFQETYMFVVEETV